MLIFTFLNFKNLVRKEHHVAEVLDSNMKDPKLEEVMICLVSILNRKKI